MLALLVKYIFLTTFYAEIVEMTFQFPKQGRIIVVSRLFYFRILMPFLVVPLNDCRFLELITISSSSSLLIMRLYAVFSEYINHVPEHPLRVQTLCSSIKIQNYSYLCYELNFSPLPGLELLTYGVRSRWPTNGPPCFCNYIETLNWSMTSK